MRIRFHDLTGQRFGKLVVIERATQAKSGNWRWHCICDCGGKTISQAGNLKSGGAHSCGCIRRNQLKTHGLYYIPEYAVWIMMKQRCRNPRNRDFKDYGGRGIHVCKRWYTFENFIADMGRRPTDEHSIERVNNDGNYEPGNCIWATEEVQKLNKRSRKPGTSASSLRRYKKRALAIQSTSNDNHEQRTGNTNHE